MVDEEDMRRRFYSLTLMLAVGLAGPGCFAVDELDAGLASMKGAAPEEAAEPAVEESSGGDDAAERAKALQAKAKNLWKNARTPTSKEAPADPGAELVGCKIGGSTRFMSRTDCLTQGGSV